MRLAQRGGRGNKYATHCKYGHAFDVKNTYYNPNDGQRACRACKARIQSERYHAVRKTSPAWVKKNSERIKMSRIAARERLFSKLGGQRCACCGETIYEFLSFDHIHGGGSKERVRGGSSLAWLRKWLRRDDVQEVLQVLCHNCNQAKGYYGICPHAVMASRGRV